MANIKQFSKIKVVLLELLLISLTLISFSGAAHAVDQNCSAADEKANKCIARYDKEYKCTSNDVTTCVNSNPITAFVGKVIRILSAAVGLVVVIMLIVGGIRYSSSGGDPQAVAAAKNQIRNAIFALLAFFFTFAFLNYVVPGGLL